MFGRLETRLIRWEEVLSDAPLPALACGISSARVEGKAQMLVRAGVSRHVWAETRGRPVYKEGWREDSAYEAVPAIYLPQLRPPGVKGSVLSHLTEGDVGSSIRGGHRHSRRRAPVLLLAGTLERVSGNNRLSGLSLRSVVS